MRQRCLQFGRAILRVRNGSIVFALVALSALSAIAAPPRVLPQGTAPADKRLAPPKDYDGYFPFTPPATKEVWEARAREVRRQMEVAFGLWPRPTATPLEPVIHGLVDRENYTVEKVYFQSMPGFFVTGSLYRPKPEREKMPVVLCPHGHWNEGRFHDAGVATTRKQIAIGGERFEEGGRSPLQARCVQLARMGCVVFHYDMIGYADSTQLSFELVHRFAKQRPDMNTEQNWGFYSPQAEANLESVMGLQTWNNMRALDFVLGLPKVDPARVAVTGASGGGTQTMILAALDARVTLSVPCVMVSTSMQGGCTCENCSLLRVDTGNIEFASLFAPKPQLCTSANDWTKEMLTKGYPELQQLYELLGAKQNVSLANLTYFDHNYNHVSRTYMYNWVNKHFKLGLEEPVLESDYKRLTREEMSVWDSSHPKPSGGDDYERKLARQWYDDSQQQLAALKPKDSAGLAKFREVVGGGVSAVIGRGLPKPSDITWDEKIKNRPTGYLEAAGLLRNAATGAELPAVFLHPENWKERVVIWADEQGKAGLYTTDGTLRPEVKKLVDAGITVVGVDLLYQGEFLADGKPLTQTPRVKNPREFAGYTFGYNYSVFAQRVQDLLTVIAFVKEGYNQKPKQVDLVGFESAGPLAAAARAIAGSAVTCAAVDTGGFRFGKVSDWQSPQFLPGGAKYLDLPGMLALSAPEKLYLAGEGEKVPEVLMSAFEASGAAGNLTTFAGKPEGAPAAAVEWLLKP